jgi:hypothetical protein
VLRVRLCDGDQVLAERELPRLAMVDPTDDLLDWELARSAMHQHDVLVGFGMTKSAAVYFNRAVATLFPEFGTPPDGVET